MVVGKRDYTALGGDGRVLTAGADEDKRFWSGRERVRRRDKVLNSKLEGIVDVAGVAVVLLHQSGFERRAIDPMVNGDELVDDRGPQSAVELEDCYAITVVHR